MWVRRNVALGMATSGFIWMASVRTFCNLSSSTSEHIAREFEQRYIPEPNSGCWLWLAATMGNGYGQFSYLGMRESAHRHSYRVHNGPISDHNDVLHKCDIPCCVNPDHLFVGTHADNMNDMARKRRHPGNPRTPGMLRPRAKLSPLLADEIRMSPKSPRELADHFRVHIETIYRVRRGECYRKAS